MFEVIKKACVSSSVGGKQCCLSYCCSKLLNDNRSKVP